MTLINAQQRPEGSGRLAVWVTKDSQTPVLGIMQPGRYLARAMVHVTEAFNSDDTDTLTVGYTTDTDAAVTSIDVSSTGIKTATLGALSGYNATARTLEAYYVNGGSEPTTGKALVILELLPVPLSP